jgi:hypothetical protein
MTDSDRLGISATTFLTLCIAWGPDRACFVIGLAAIIAMWIAMCRRWPFLGHLTGVHRRLHQRPIRLSKPLLLSLTHSPLAVNSEFAEASQYAAHDWRWVRLFPDESHSAKGGRGASLDVPAIPRDQ